jgi:hypothetical protein
LILALLNSTYYVHHLNNTIETLYNAAAPVRCQLYDPYMDNDYPAFNVSADGAATHVVFGRQSPDTNSRSRMNHVVIQGKFLGKRKKRNTRNEPK